MKASTTIAIFIALTILAGKATAAACDSPFHAWLKKIDPNAVLAASDTPAEAASAPCNAIWRANGGNCCNVDKAKDIFKAKTDEVKKSWDQFINSVNKIKDGGKKLGAMAPPTTAEAKTQFTAMSTDTANYPMNGITPEQAAAIMDKVKTLDASIATFKDKAKPCFEAIKAVRSPIFCYGCAAGTASMFTAGPPLSYNFLTGTCNAAVAACVPVWDFMLTAQAITTLGALLKMKKNNGQGDKPAPPKMPKSKTLGDIKDFMDKCPTGKVEGSCTQDMLDNLCGIMINFSKPEPIAEPPNDAEMNKMGTRLLQTTDEGVGNAAAGGIDLSAKGGFTADTSIDASASGSSAKSIFFGATLALLALLF